LLAVDKHSSEGLSLCSSPRDGSRHERFLEVAFFTHDLFSQQSQRRRNLWPPSFLASHVPESTTGPEWMKLPALLEQSSLAIRRLSGASSNRARLRPAGSLRRPGLHPRGHDHPHLHAREIMGRDLQRRPESPALPGLVLLFAGTVLAAVCSNGAGNAARSPARAPVLNCTYLEASLLARPLAAVSTWRHGSSAWPPARLVGCAACRCPCGRFASATRLSLSWLSCF
jgi:hypothetical protein